MTIGKSAKTLEIEETIRNNPHLKTSTLAERFNVSSAYISRTKGRMRADGELAENPSLQKVRREAAALRRITPEALDEAILRTVYGDNMVDAILDDGLKMEEAA